MKRLIAIGLATASLVVGVGSTSASGQATPDAGLPPASSLTISSLANQLMSDPTFRKSVASTTPIRVKAAKFRAIVFKDSAPPSNMAAKLAATFPADRQDAIRGGLEGVLAVVPSVEQEFGMPHNDLGAAAAMFVAASGQSYSGIEIDTDAQFRPLITQMRNVMAANPKVAKASETAKREFFDELMMLGLLQFGVQASLQKTPDPGVSAVLRTSGAEYLQTFLGIAPATLQFTGSGLKINASGGSSPTENPAPTTTPPATPGTTPGENPAPGGNGASEASAISDQIETVAFWSKTGVGFGGSLTFDPTPIVLFRNGDAVYDIEALKFPGGLAAHRSANPKDWTKWRRGGKKFEVQKEGGWASLPYTSAMDRLPRGFLLDRAYQTVGGGGNLAVGGSSSVVVWSNLQFDRSGNFSSGGGAGSSTGGGGAGVVTGGSSGPQPGTYSIDGYTLMLKYASGRVEKRMIVADPSDTGVIWLDGTGYRSKR
jgi:hypothetical protein